MTPRLNTVGRMPASRPKPMAFRSSSMLFLILNRPICRSVCALRIRNSVAIMKS